MKKYAGCIIAVCLLVVATTASAQRPVKVREIKPVSRSGALGTAGSVVTRTPVKTPVTAGVTRSVAGSVAGTVSNARAVQHGQVLTREHTPVGGSPQRITSPATNLHTVDALVAQHGQLQAENQQLGTVGFGGGFGKSVLFAPVEKEGKDGGFSVTALEVNGEIFGVIASHVLAESYYTYSVSLHKNFHLHVLQPDGSTALLEAHVVQVAPRSMLDVSLVKFSPQAEALVHPLSLADAPAQPGELLFSYGFANGEAQQIERTVSKNSFISVRTDQNLTGKRAGFCGSPLLDAAGNIKAIHTGTLENRSGTEAVSYGTHARFIRLLVEAYHNNGQAEYDLTIDGQTFARLNVDEYISAVYLYDANGKRIIQRNWEEKFSQSALLNMLEENPQAAYLQFTSRKAHWETDNDGDSILKEDRSKNDKTKRQHWYNLQTREILPIRPGIIKL